MPPLKVSEIRLRVYVTPLRIAGKPFGITPDGRARTERGDGFVAEAGCYHLYVSLACLGAHRRLIFRALKGLEGMIGYRSNHGWKFK